MQNRRLALVEHPYFRKPLGPVVQIIFDGIGIGDPLFPFNAVTEKYFPDFFNLLRLGINPHATSIGASSRFVGLDDDVVGNSEVGHNCIGTGQFKVQGGRLVNAALESGEVTSGAAWQDHILRPILESQSTRTPKTLHLMGVIQDTTIVHADLRHIIALIEDAKQKGIQSLAIHGFTDGRDDPDRHALDLFEGLESLLDQINAANQGYHYRVASGGGRMRMTMDRYEDSWSMVERGWRAHVLGLVDQSQGGAYVPRASAAIRAYYAQPDPSYKELDQYVYPFVVTDSEGVPLGKILDGDSVVFCNFRGDRAIEISRAFEDATFHPFDRVRTPRVQYAGMTLYDGDNHVPSRYLVSAPSYSNTMADLLVADGIPMFAISETAKFGHVTYFADGNRSSVREGYHSVLVPGNPNETFVSEPGMKAAEIAHATAQLIHSGNFRFGRVNFANPDMIGHTGDWPAVLKAMNVLDGQLKLLLRAIEAAHGIAVILSDHGNADEMVRRKKNGDIAMRGGIPIPNMSHTGAPVPLLIYDPSQQQPSFIIDPGLSLDPRLPGDVPGPSLLNVAATTLNLLGYKAPDFYYPSLIRPE